MFCKRVIYINWGNIPPLEFDFGPINLFSGGNGSGKTTAADGLQSLMTAAHENLFTYNPGQDETTQRGRGGKQVRTLASYVLGCDDGSYARPHACDGYVAGVFHPTEGEGGETFTAVMCVRAHLDSASASRQARQDELLFLIIPNQQLCLQDFLREDPAGQLIVPLPEIANRLKRQFGSDAVEIYDKKGPYLRRLYGAFRGMPGAISDREAKHAARTFANFMAYKPVKSISAFVEREILEPKDLSEDIRQVSELMKTIHSMDEETRAIQRVLENLDVAQSHAATYIANWLDHCVGQYCELSRQVWVKQQGYLGIKDQQRLNVEAIGQTERDIQDNAELKRATNSQLVDLAAQRRGIAALRDKDQLEQELEACEQNLVASARSLLEQEPQFAHNYQAIRQLQQSLKSSSLGVEIPALESKALNLLITNLLQGPEDSGLDMPQLMTKDWVGIGALEHKLEQVKQLDRHHSDLALALHSAERSSGPRSIRDQVLTLSNDRQRQLSQSKERHERKQVEIQRLEHNKINYPPHVEAALKAIHSQCPDARAAVLCDFVEIIDPKWQMAIEGYMGGARFAIIVEPEYEAEAIRVVRGMKGGRNNARVIQGEKAQRDAAKITLAQDSIVELMEFDHKIVEYYLQASYGSVLRVQDEEGLRRTRRGVTRTGLGSGNYAMFRCDLNDADLVFGQGARQRALEAKRQELSDLQHQRQQQEDEYRQAARLYELIESIKALQCADLLTEMLTLYRARQHSEEQLQNLDLSDFEELETRMQAVQLEFDALDKGGSELNSRLGALEEKKSNLTVSIDTFVAELERLQEDRDEREARVTGIASYYPEFDSEAALQEAEVKARAAKGDFSFVEENSAYCKQLDQHDRALYQAIMQHNQMATLAHNIIYAIGHGEQHAAEYFQSIAKMAGELQAVHNALKNNVLVGKAEKLATLRDSFNTAFVSNLCHSIYQAINDGKRVLEELNKELEHHVFGSDRERFYFDWQWVPEFKEYWRFFKEVVNLPNLGDGNSLFDADLNPQSCLVRDKLVAMLLDKDEQAALRELRRISDYRLYRRYEIYKKPENKEPIALSKYGTGSGGQLETPAYIIRSAAVTSAFRYNEGSSHCRMVLVDEAFSKMDEARSREVIHYLTEALGLQLIFIMPTSKSGPFLDLISNQVVFSKCPATEKVGELDTHVLVDRKVCNQEKIKALWARHRKTIRNQAMLDFMDDL
ncbi:MAG: hypothetical protein KBT88_08515 [Gammaproteobacteria bacterium]|nr:hypothetical protein [Gammaproteobacteria bacterium]MBQ0839817.1 hypothetical protein [Gammaproteobacteria bacterium]